MFKLQERDQPEDLSVDERIMLNCVLKKKTKRGVDWVNLAQDRVNWWGPFEHINEILGPIKLGEFLDS